MGFAEAGVGPGRSSRCWASRPSSRRSASRRRSSRSPWPPSGWPSPWSSGSRPSRPAARPGPRLDPGSRARARLLAARRRLRLRRHARPDRRALLDAHVPPAGPRVRRRERGPVHRHRGDGPDALLPRLRHPLRPVDRAPAGHAGRMRARARGLRHPPGHATAVGGRRRGAPGQRQHGGDDPDAGGLRLRAVPDRRVRARPSASSTPEPDRRLARRPPLRHVPRPRPGLRRGVGRRHRARPPACPGGARPPGAPRR